MKRKVLSIFLLLLVILGGVCLSWRVFNLPDLFENEYGFYFNKKYKMAAFNGDDGIETVAVVFQKNNKMKVYDNSHSPSFYPVSYSKGTIKTDSTWGDFYVLNSKLIKSTHLFGYFKTGRTTIKKRDYIYTFGFYGNGWNVAVKNKGKKSYGEIKNELQGYPVSSMQGTFQGCKNLIVSPKIPPKVRLLSNTYAGCTSLKEAPMIPDCVEAMSGTFLECDKLSKAPVLPSSVIYLDCAFMGCTSLKEAPVIPKSVKFMGNAFTECKELSVIHPIPRGVQDINQVFKMCNKILSIEYQGTMEEWSLLIKNSEHWNPDGIISEVVCSDGKIEI